MRESQLHIHKRVLVTDGAGFVGSYLCEQLLAQRCEVLCIDKFSTGPVNIGNPGEFTIRQLARLVIEMTGSKSPLEFRPLPQDDPKQRQPNIDIARSALGWEPAVSLRAALEQTIAYFDGLLKTTPSLRL